MTQDVWLTNYPYLRPLAELQAVTDSVMDEIAVPSADIPIWEDYFEVFVAGTPLLRSNRVEIDFRPLEDAVVPLVQKLLSQHLTEKLHQQCQSLVTELGNKPGAPLHSVTWLLDKNTLSTSQPGLLQYLGWSLLVRYLSRLLPVFANWRDEERWLRTYCPACGSAPAMAQLVGIDPGRLRLLSCGRCNTRWRYRRTQCPFCESDEHRLAGFSVEGSPLRIDYCEACGGYIKTYNGEGSETVLLADSMSIHLDILACDLGLKRFAGSLYQF